MAGNSVRSSLVLHPDASGDPGGTFALTLVPPDISAADAPERPRNIVFVLDRSGSMEGWKMVAARRAVERMVETLRPIDRFSLLAFDNS
jgi:Ca-activated chloride channel family protein